MFAGAGSKVGELAEAAYLSSLADSTPEGKSIIELAHNLHMEVIAEGVETEEQLSHLKGLQCEYGQGYYFSRLVDAESAGGLIAP